MDDDATPAPPAGKERPRNGNGEFVRSPQTARREARAAELRGRGWSYRRIAADLQVDVKNAYDMVQRALKAIVAEAAEDARTFELERLDAELVRLEGLEAAAREVLERRHVTVSHGQVVDDPQTGDPLLDDGPVLQAVDRLLKIEDARRRNGESRRKLLGLDAPSRVSVDAEQLGNEIGALLDQLTGGNDDDPGQRA